jgi:hypothetical protein
MCLKTMGEFIKQTADRPIICYKSGNLTSEGKFRPTFYDEFRYSLNEETEYVEIKPKYHEIKPIYYHNGFYDESKLKIERIEEGYHSYKKSNIIANNVFIIPKGATYYSGSVNEYDKNDGYVSSSLIWIGHAFSIMTWIRYFKYKLSKK